VTGYRRAVATGTVLSVLVAAAWSYLAVLTTARPAPVPHMTANLLSDYTSVAGAPTGSGLGLFAVTAGIYTLCLLAAGWRQRP
jgi:hypothetical protein